MNSLKGRPRKVTDAQVAAILAWYRNRKSLRQLAAELSLSPKLVRYVIARRGEYKQASPERRAEVARLRRERVRILRAGGWM